jgi:hypothetical protein
MATLAFSDTQLEKRNVIARAIKSVRQNAIDIFEPSEEAFLYRERLGVGCWIGVKSIRHGKLFDLLAKNYFKNLDRYVCNSSDGRVWVRFGYDLNLRVRLEIEEVAAHLEPLSASGLS